MAYFHTCKTCSSKDGCDIKQGLKNSIRGLNITSLKHKCDGYNSIYEEGEPVFVTLYVCKYTGPMGETDCFEETYEANFIGWSKTGIKAVCFISNNAPSLEDEDIKYSHEGNRKGYVKITLKNVTKNENGFFYIPKHCIWCNAIIFDEKCSCDNSIVFGVK